MGQLKQAKIFNTPLVPGLALDAQGQPTTDPQQATIPMPMAGPKGSGLAMMFELMCSLVVGNPIIADYFSDKPAARKHRQNAWLLAVDIGRFSALVDFQQEVARTVDTLRGLAPSDASEPIRMPGERGQRCHAQRMAEGIPLSAAVINELSACPRPDGMALPW